MDYGKLAGPQPPEEERLLREGWIRREIVPIAEDMFPEDVGLEWVILGFEHGGPFSIAEAEPRPATVGYPKFRFALEFTGGAMECLGVYCLTQEGYTLLASNPGADLPRKL